MQFSSFHASKRVISYECSDVYELLFEHPQLIHSFLSIKRKNLKCKRAFEDTLEIYISGSIFPCRLKTVTPKKHWPVMKERMNYVINLNKFKGNC